MIKKHRVFVAINLPQEVKKELASYEEKWPELPAKWAGSDNLHITLVFLGSLTDTELGEVCMVAKEVAQRHSYFNLNLNKVMYGPQGKSPRMVWAEGEKSLPAGRQEKSFYSLRRDLEDSLLEKVRFKPETRSFSPHVTLARIKEWEFKQINLDERPEIDENIDLAIPVESIEVMESVLKKSGPEYEIIESYSLNSQE